MGILGPWIVHLFEAEVTLMERFVTKMRQKQTERNSYYQDIHVIHFTEDVDQRAFSTWSCKSIQTSQATSEIKTMVDEEKVSYIYANMVKLGVDAAHFENKGPAYQIS